MTNRNSVVLFVSVLCLLTIGSWADEVRGGQPVTSSLLVRIHLALKVFAASAILWSSAAINISSGSFALQICSYVCWMRNLPVSLARTLAGNLVELYLAGIHANTFTISTFDSQWFFQVSKTTSRPHCRKLAGKWEIQLGIYSTTISCSCQ